MRKVALSPIRPNASPAEKLDWCVRTIQELVRASHIPEALVASQVPNDLVTNAMLADMAQATFKMRAAGAGTGDPIDGTATQARTALGLATTDSPTFASLTLTANFLLPSGGYIDWGSNNVRITHSSGQLNITGGHLRITNTLPNFVLKESDATADEGGWQIAATADTIVLGTFNDAEDTFDQVFTVTRTGIVPDQFSVGCHINAESGFVYRVNGTQVVTAQQSAIANLAWAYTANDPGTAPNSAVTFADGTALVAATAYEAFDEIEAKINAILGALRTHGLIAT